MPPIPLAISSQSRKKLNAFVFDEGLIALEGDKENQVVSSQSKKLAKEKDSAVGNHVYSEHNLPRTPAVRIPIEDLIANTEDAFNCAPPIATPKDHVLWQTHPDSSNASIAAAGTQRSRKRAHSSSPASSQQLSAQKDALNLDTLNKSLRTPNNDPTQDLWNRYTTSNALRNDQPEPILPAYAHLLPSSPVTPSTSGKDSSALRRTHSCGVEWPTSKAKRRKQETTELHGRTKELFAASRKDILRHDLSNNTRVGLLLEKIQESLAKKVPADESPSSSSPLPDRRSQVHVSPTKPPNRDGLAVNPSQENGLTHKQTPTPKAASQVDLSFSEFSDDGLDLEAFESVEQALAQSTTVKAAHIAADNADDTALSHPRGGGISSQTVLQSRNPSQANGSKNLLEGQAVLGQTDFDDEFDEDDELMNEMLDLAAQYDSKTSQPVGDQVAGKDLVPATNVHTKRLETLDEFEDAFDDDVELWEGIARATSGNATPETTSSTHPVRFG